MKNKIITLFHLVLIINLSSIVFSACPTGLETEEAAISKIKELVAPILSSEEEFPNIYGLLPSILDLTDAYLSSDVWEDVCNDIGERTNKPIDEAVADAEDILAEANITIIKCGEIYNFMCDNNDKPKYCLNGTLVDDCQKCGCPNGYLCQTQNGTCAQNQTNTTSCIDSDATAEYPDGKNVYLKGNLSGSIDSCYTESTVRENYCNEFGNHVLGYIDCPNGTVCDDGACISPSVCGNNEIEGDEVCDGSDLAGKTCQDFGYQSLDEYDSISCCDDCSKFDIEACRNWTKTCFDHDGGADYNTSSFIDFYSLLVTGPSCISSGHTYENNYSLSDTCNGNILMERICNPDGSFSYLNYTCPINCSEGACIESSPTDTTPPTVLYSWNEVTNISAKLNMTAYDYESYVDRLSLGYRGPDHIWRADTFGCGGQQFCSHVFDIDPSMGGGYGLYELDLKASNMDGAWSSGISLNVTFP